MTAKIAAANMANKCHASFCQPAGIGENQMAKARAKEMACWSRCGNSLFPAFIFRLLCYAPRAVGLTGPGP